MTYQFLKWVQGFIAKGTEAWEFLISTPFSEVQGMPDTLKNMTPLMLVGLSGLIVFIVVAVVKWIVS